MANINIIGLGGLDEIHKNLYLIEIDAKIFIVDAGMYEPISANLGIQHFIPKLDYLNDMRDRVKGVFLTSANKIENGAITEILKIVPNVPVYGSEETIEFLKLVYKNTDSWNLKALGDKEAVDFGGVTVEPKLSASSLPGTYNWIFHTEDGAIVYSVNSIFDSIKQFNEKNELAKVDQEVLLYMIDSRNMFLESSISPNYKIKKRIEGAFASHEGRIVTAVYEDELINIAEIIELARKYNRPVSILSDRIYKFVKYLMQSDKMISYEIKDKVQGKDNEVIIYSQTRTNLFKGFKSLLIEDDENILKVTEEDLVIVASPAQPGNEHVYATMSNEIARHQSPLIDFSYAEKPTVHPSQFDLINFLRIYNPKHIMPIKGYYKEMIKTVPIAVEAGIPAENIIIADNGDKISFKNGKLLGKTDEVPNGEAIIDDATDSGINIKVIEQRDVLATHGLVTIAFILDKETKEFLSDIDVQMKGVVFVKSQDKLLQEIRDDIETIIEENKSDLKMNKVISMIKKTSEKTIRRHTTKSPAVVIDIHEN